MKAALIIPGTGPILILTSYPSLTDERFIEKLELKGVTKFIAFEVSTDEAERIYGARYHTVAQDLGATEDMRVLDYNSHTAFHNFSFDKLGELITHEK